MTSLTDIANKIINRKGNENLANMMTKKEVQEAIEAAVLSERKRCINVCDNLYKHDRKSSGYDEGWNDALDIAGQLVAETLTIEQVLRSTK